MEEAIAAREPEASDQGQRQGDELEGEPDQKHRYRHGEPPVQRPRSEEIPETNREPGEEESRERARRDEESESSNPELPAVIGASLGGVGHGSVSRGSGCPATGGPDGRRRASV